MSELILRLDKVNDKRYFNYYKEYYNEAIKKLDLLCNQMSAEDVYESLYLPEVRLLSSLLIYGDIDNYKSYIESKDFILNLRIMLKVNSEKIKRIILAGISREEPHGLFQSSNTIKFHFAYDDICKLNVTSEHLKKKESVGIPNGHIEITNITEITFPHQLKCAYGHIYIYCFMAIVISLIDLVVNNMYRKDEL